MAGTPYLIGTASAPGTGTGVLKLSVSTGTSQNDSIVVAIATTNTANDATQVFDTQGNFYGEILGPTGSGSISGSVWQADACTPLTGADYITIVTVGAGYWNFEDGQDNWAGANASISQYSGWAANGNFSLLIVASGGAGAWGATSLNGFLPVVGSTAVNAFATFNAINGITAAVNVTFYDASFNFLSTSSGSGTALTAGTISTISNTGITAPPTAAWMTMTCLDTLTASAGVQFAVDNCVLFNGTVQPVAAVAVGDNNVGLTVSVEDQTASNTGSSTSPSSGSTSTLGQTYEHAIAFTSYLGAGGTDTWASPWSSNVLANVVDSSTSIRLSAAFQDVTTTAALTATGTLGSSTSWATLLVTNRVANLGIVNQSVPNGIVGLAYSVALQSQGGVGAVTWSLLNGALPNGLSLGGNTISGTPTAAGTFTFTIQASAATFGPTTTQNYTIVIAASGASSYAQAVLSANLLTAADSNLSAGFTWSALTNASAVASTPRVSLTGPQAGYWTATANGTTAIATGSYPAKPNLPYVVSGFMLPLGGVRNLYIGVQWLNGTGGVISTSGGPAAPLPNPAVSAGSYWTPVVNTVTSPPGTASAKVVLWVDSPGVGNVTVLASEMTIFGSIFLTQSSAQVSIDFVNPSFGTNAVTGQAAGSSFMDVSPWLRKDIGINMARGRQDAISEIQAGSASFSLQNDQGVFTRFDSNSFLALLGATGGAVNLQTRFQINIADQIGNWFTRWDGQISQVDYTFDNTGTTSIAQFNGTDILGYLNRQPSLRCWTYEEILSDDPLYFWPLNDYDAVNNIVSFAQNTLQQTVNVQTSGFSVAAEMSGNGGPPMRLYNTAKTGSPTIAWADTSSGVETLADAVKPNNPDGSEFWTPGSNQPSSLIRGLDSGAVGPFTTPLPNILLAPVITPGAAQNTFNTVQGWELFAELFGTQVLHTQNNAYTFEIYFTINPAVANTYLIENVGPFCVFGLGSTRNLYNIAAGIWVGGAGGTTFKINTYNNPPTFAVKNFSVSPPAAVGSISTSFTPDAGACPHHLVIQIQEDGGTGSVVTAFLDGVAISGTLTLPAKQAFDTVSVGGPHGGGGHWYGAVTCCAVYPTLLTQDQITEHCQRGQYGAWEQTADQAINELIEFANVPSYWANVQNLGNGLSLTEYMDITGQNPLASMQVFEAAEAGLLYVNSLGQLSFYTRDWKMGSNVPDLFLPPNTHDGTALGYELIDQYQNNESAISSLTFPTGASYVNVGSQTNYGTYSPNPIGSPLQLPLVSFNRGFAVLGLASFTFWPDPNLIDLASWQAIHFGDPFLTPASVTVDLLTLDTTTSLTITDFYNLDIGRMIAPSGAIPKSFPNAALSTNWFIEGVNETYSLQARSIQFYTSPAEIQQAWMPGDSTYGVLGSTARLGISAADTNAPEADGKDVSHDGGPPYWPPTFVANAWHDATVALTPAAYYPLSGTSAADASGNNRNMTPANPSCVLFRVPNPPVAGADMCVQMFGAANGALASSYAPSGGSSWTAECWVNLGGQLTGATAGNNNPRVFASSHTSVDKGGFEIYLSGGNTPVFVIGNGTAIVTLASGITMVSGWYHLVLTWGNGIVTAYVDGAVVAQAGLSGSMGASTGDLTIGGGTYMGDYYNGLIGQCALYQSALSANTVYTRYAITAFQNGMNNNAGDGRFFVGANDMRGIATNFQRLLTPPMCVVGQQVNTKAYASGSLTDPTMYWDTIYVDTEGGMGLIAGYPNWYVVTVPGFYEIDATVVTGGSYPNQLWQSWIIVAQAGAQNLQAGIGTPLANLRYVCPVGETRRFDTAAVGAGQYTIAAPSTRMYLGVGDMVAIGCNHDVASTNISTSTGNGGSFLSIRWTGLSNTGDDRAEDTSTIEGGVITDPAGFIGLSSITLTNSGCFSYGNLGGFHTTLANYTNKIVAQGGTNATQGDGIRYAQVPFNFSTLRRVLTGATVVSGTIHCTNLTSRGVKGGADLLVGLYYGKVGKQFWQPTFTIAGQDTRARLAHPIFLAHSSQTFTIPASMIRFMLTTLNGQNCNALFIGDNSSAQPAYNTTWKGTPGSWSLTVNYRV